ncbi:MAG: acetyl-CoA carboxylase carboxyltransferase subunit alpha [Candidatus Eremiobacteraeota bacterium]|nr:acetyl-CoA carboxylase carboxyltransferase subunit alpha [Candidatus Eremiobacteraeota bacterium]
MILEIEKPLKELEEKIKALKEVNLSGKIDLSREIQALEKKAQTLKKNIYGNLSSWDRVQLARHPQRPATSDYIENVFDEFFELHGDRHFADDPAVMAGFAILDGRTVVVVGHQKGKDTKENIARNFGMPNPEGLRKARRVLDLGAKFGFPAVSFIDTPGAYPGLEAEERGQSEAIASNIAHMFSLPVPIVVIIIGEGGSGGALALGVGDRIMMLENAIYSVISPEGCASILWRDSHRASAAAEALKLTSYDLREMGIIDLIVPEPMGGVHKNSEAVFIHVKDELIALIDELGALPRERLLEERFGKFRSIGVYKGKERKAAAE